MTYTPRTNDECRRRAQLRVSAWNVSADFARELERELAQRTAERDEARRDCCAFEGILRFNNAHPKGIISQEATLRLANEIAAERAWDCFTTHTNTPDVPVQNGGE
jgi:hypothetical protein